MNIDKQLLWEAVKEPLRLLALALLAWILTAIVPQMDEAWIVPTTIVLRFLDKYLHELGKVQDSPTLTRGITQF